MRIIITTYSIVPRPFGLTARLSHNIRTLVNAGHEVTLISLGDGTLASTDSLEGATHVRAVVDASAAPLARAEAFGEFVLAYFVEHGPFEVVHVSSAWDGYPILKRRDSDRKRRFRVIYEVNTLDHIDMAVATPETLSEIKAREAELARGADGIITPSRTTRIYTQILGAQPRRITVMPRAVDAEMFPVAPLPPEGEWPGKTPTVLYVGSFAPGHAPAMLMRAVAQVLQQRAVKLRLVGPASAEQSAELKKLASSLGLKKASFSQEDAVPHEAVPALIAESTLCVLPLVLADRNVMLGHAPVSMLEYMASGRPVIATDLPIMREVARPGVDALLTMPESVDDLASGILRLLDDERLARQLALNAQQRVRADFSWEVSRQKVLRAYGNLKRKGSE